MTADDIRTIDDITLDNLMHRNRQSPSIAALVEPDGSVRGVPMYGPHPLHYLWDKLDRGAFRVAFVDFDYVFWTAKDGGADNPAGPALLGRPVEGPLVVTPKVMNFNLSSHGFGL